MYYLKKYFISLLVLLFCLIHLFAQNSLSLDKLHSKSVLKYKISNEQMIRYLTCKNRDKQLPALIKSFPKSLVDSALFNNIDSLRKGYGNYLLVGFSNNALSYDLYTKTPFSVHSFANKSVCSIVVLDEKGSPISDALVKYGKSRFVYNPQTQVYELKTGKYKKNEELLTVYYDGYCFATYMIVYDKDTNYRDDDYSTNSYISVDKPKYSKGDTLRWKAVVMDKSGLWKKDSLKLRLLGAENSVFKVAPQRRGVYFGEIVLNDSIGVMSNTYLRLEIDESKYFAYADFFCEDYELSKLRLKVIVPPNVNDKEQAILKIITTDQNGFPIVNGKIDIELYERLYDNTYLMANEQVIGPKYTNFSDIPIASSGITEFKVPSFFTNLSNYNVACKVNVTMLDGQQLSDYSYITYDNRPNVAIKKAEAKIDVVTRNDADTVGFAVVNEEHIQFNYSIFCNRKLIASGCDTILNWKIRPRTNAVYEILYTYMNNDMIESDSKMIIHSGNMLKIEVEQPSEVKPGEKVKIKIRVTDEKSKPVEGAEVLAQSITSKFNYKFKAPKFIYNKYIYNLLSTNGLYSYLMLYSNTFFEYSNIDEISRLGMLNNKYYRLFNPGDSVVIYTRTINDSVSQIAPYVVENHKLQHIYYILVDGVPVYCNLRTNIEDVKYSFPVNVGKHNISIRTSDALYKIKNVEVPEFSKVWLSVAAHEMKNSRELKNSQFDVIKMPKKFLKYEVSMLERYYSFVQATKYSNFSYIRAKSYIIPFSNNEIVSSEDSYIYHVKFDTTIQKIPWLSIPNSYSMYDVTNSYRLIYQNIDKVFSSPLKSSYDLLSKSSDLMITESSMYDQLIREIDAIRQTKWNLYEQYLKTENTKLLLLNPIDKPENSNLLLNYIVDSLDNGSVAKRYIFAGDNTTNDKIPSGDYKITFLWCDSTYSVLNTSLIENRVTVLPLIHDSNNIMMNSLEIDSVVFELRKRANSYILNREERSITESIFISELLNNNLYGGDNSSELNNSVRIRGIGSVHASMNAKYDDDFDEMILEDDFSEDIRTKFSDVGYWEPDLVTDENGEVTFTVKYPDDVTKWQEFFVAMRGKKRGSYSSFVNAQLPLVSSLNMPRFAIEGDSFAITGVSQKYISDTLNLVREFRENTKLNISYGPSLLDSLSIVDSCQIEVPNISSSSDTLLISYRSIDKQRDISDGEQRELVVLPIGLEQIDGVSYVFDRVDTTLKINSLVDDSPILINLYGDLFPLLIEELDKANELSLSSNDGLASQLHVLLLQQKIAQFNKEKFKNKNKIKNIISKLENNKNCDGLWSWFGNNRDYSSLWVSNYIYKVLRRAKDMGYSVESVDNRDKFLDNMIKMFDRNKKRNRYSSQIEILEIINQLDFQNELNNMLSEVSRDSLDYSDILRYDIISQRCGKKVDFSLYDTLAHREMLGGLFYEFKLYPQFRYSVNYSTIRTTLLMYQLLLNSRDVLQQEKMKDIEQWLYTQRHGCFCSKGYEGIQIVEVLLDSYMNQGEKWQPNKVVIQQKGNKKEITKFPYSDVYHQDSEIYISKQGPSPIFVSAVQRHFESQPKTKEEKMSISTNIKDADIERGKGVDLEVVVTMDRVAENLVISVPVPAGFGYDVEQHFGVSEVHREQLRNQVNIYCERLLEGENRFVVKLMPRFSGRFTLNPAQVKLFYFPSFNANNEIKKVEIK